MEPPRKAALFPCNPQGQLPARRPKNEAKGTSESSSETGSPRCTAIANCRRSPPLKSHVTGLGRQEARFGCRICPAPLRFRRAQAAAPRCHKGCADGPRTARPGGPGAGDSVAALWGDQPDTQAQLPRGEVRVGAGAGRAQGRQGCARPPPARRPPARCPSRPRPDEQPLPPCCAGCWSG